MKHSGHQQSYSAWGFIVLLALVVVVVIVLTVAVSYWLLVTTEGVFLGHRVVIWLYNYTAHRYDDIKQFDDDDERYFIVRPLLRELKGKDCPTILDVATGTGRVPFAIASNPGFEGIVVGLDAAHEMLKYAAEKFTRPNRDCAGVYLVQQRADKLPFNDNTFDAVTCLESLEFFPSDQAALLEMVRVLRPGGLLLTSRRRGPTGYFFLRRYRSIEDFENLMTDIKLTDIRTNLWEMDYDLVSGRKPLANVVV